MNTIKNDDANEDEYHWRYQERIPSEEEYHWYKWRLKPLIIPRKWYHTKWRWIPKIQMKIQTIDNTKIKDTIPSEEGYH